VERGEGKRGRGKEAPRFDVLSSMRVVRGKGEEKGKKKGKGEKERERKGREVGQNTPSIYDPNLEPDVKQKGRRKRKRRR